MKPKLAKGDQEPRPPGQGVVGVLGRADPEGLDPVAEIGLRRLGGQHLVGQHEGEDEHRADGQDRRGDEHDEQVVGEPLGDVDAAEDADVLGDAQGGGDGAALELGHLVGDGGDERCQGHVGAQLSERPADRGHHQARGERHDREGGGHQDGAEHDPDAPAAPLRRRAVGDASEHHVGQRGEDGADAAEDARGAGGTVGVDDTRMHQRLDLDADTHDGGAEQGDEEDQLGDE